MVKVGVEAMSGETGKRVLRWGSIGRAILMTQAWTRDLNLIISFYFL